MNIKKLMSSMTLKEKIGQLVQLTARFFISDDEAAVTGPSSAIYSTRQELDRCGSTLNFSGAEAVIAIQKRFLENGEGNRIPLLFMLDVLHGYRTIYPIPLGLGCSFDPELAKECSALAAKEAALAGVNVTFGPMVDLVRDARWGRVMESTGEDPYLNSVLAAAIVRGFQGDMGKYNVAACTKHFAGYGAPESGRDYNTVELSRHTLDEYYLPAYKATVDAGVKMFMTAFHVLGGIPMTAHSELVNGVLRGEWGFDGAIVTDYNAVREMITHGYVPDQKSAALAALDGGVDIEMMSVTFIDHVEQLIKEGKLSEARVDESVERVLRLKDELGLFEAPYRTASPSEFEKVACCAEHRAVVRRAAEKSAVLLKNDGILPFSDKVKKVAVIGPHAANKEIIGFWYCDGRFGDTVTVYDGVKKLLPEAKVTKAEGCGVALDCTDESGFEQAAKVAAEADIVILCLGEAQNDSGEGNSKLDIDLPEIQYKLLDVVTNANKNTAVLLFTGRPLAVARLDEKARAILNMWFPGTEGGSAAANLLFGRVAPSGKLSMTFPYTVAQCPIYYNRLKTGRPRTNDKVRKGYVSSYIDGPNAPLYPFGYGLTYTEFEYSEVALTNNAMPRGGKLAATVEVKNVGKRAGEETVQLYICDKYASRVRPVKELKAFKKITLKPGERKTVEFEITEEMLAFHGANGYKAEAGEFAVYIGANSDAYNSAEFVFAEEEL